MYIDIVLIIFILWGMLRGFKRGFIIELCTLMALVLGIFGAAHFGVEMSGYLEREYNADSRVSLVLAFAILFAGIVIAVFIFGKVLEGLIKLVALNMVNKVAGLVFGGLKFALILSGLIFIINGFPFSEKAIPKEWKRESYLYSPISELALIIYPKLNEKQWFEDIEKQMDEFKDDVLEKTNG
ncbi:MAG TPA: CvpA family protein [Cryomorphaceae bacterium]|nr:CvpA family protein [Cryomorphaceae bacterium]